MIKSMLRGVLVVTAVLWVAGVSAPAYSLDDNFGRVTGAEISADGVSAPLYDGVNEADRVPAIEADKAINMDSKITEHQTSREPAWVSQTLQNAQDIPWLRTVTAFLFVTSLIFMLAAFLRRRLERRGDKRASNNVTQLKILQTLSLGMKRHLMVVEFGETKLVLGLASQQVQLLHCTAPSAVETPNQQKQCELPEDKPDLIRSTSRVAMPVSSRIKEVVQGLKPLSGYEFRDGGSKEIN